MPSISDKFAVSEESLPNTAIKARRYDNKNNLNMSVPVPRLLHHVQRRLCGISVQTSG